MDKMSKVNELAKDKAAEANAAKQANDAENTKGMFTSVLKEILPEIVGALSKRDEQVSSSSSFIALSN